MNKENMRTKLFVKLLL